MEWTHWACAMAGCFVGSFLMTVFGNERRHREEQRRRDMYLDAFHRGRFYPAATQPPPTAPPAPPVVK
jgi:hypothetical protein